MLSPGCCRLGQEGSVTFLRTAAEEEEAVAVQPGMAGTGACGPISTRGNLRGLSDVEKQTSGF